MNKFYIRSVSASGYGKRDTKVEFTNGLNVICGVSDTGKSCILLCIDFIFGSRIHPFSKKKTGYTDVSMLVETDGGFVNFSRKLGKNIINVNSENKNILSGDYDREFDDNSPRHPISEVFLKLIGIDVEHRILYNRSFVKKRLTWRSFSHAFVIDEDRVHTKLPILLPKAESNSTYFQSALLFLLTGNDFKEIDECEEPKIRKAKQEEFIKRINDELGDFAERRADIEKQLSEHSNSDIEQQAKVLLAEVNAVRKRISEANERSQDLLGEILSVQEQLGESEMSLNRFRKLTGHFKTDVKRLSLVADGAVFSKSLKHTEKCPYCNGSIKSGDNTAYIEGSRAELGRIISELGDLQETEEYEVQRHASLVAELKKLENERVEIDALVSERLQPQEQELNSALKDFRTVSALQAELELISSLVGDRTSQLKSSADDRIPKGEYRVKENFPANFTKDFNKDILKTFELCRYANLTSAYFDLKKFEVFINGDEKDTDHGKGYRAFINTTLALAFRKYLLDNGKYATGLFVVDSPLLTLKQGVNDHAPESMKAAIVNSFQATFPSVAVFVLPTAHKARAL